MKNIHILPTEKPSRLHFTEFFEELVFTPKYEKLDGVNIYITSDEEIKDVRPHKGKWQLETGQILNKFPNYLTDLSECKLVIMTTDQDLIEDGVQSIPDEFLEWFVRNPSCEEVEVEELCGGCGSNDGDCWRSKECNKGYFKDKYKIIIPKEEPKKVLTEKDIFNQKDIDAVTEYINKEQQKQHLIDMMKSDEELGLYDDIKANRIELVCKDCSDSLEDCTCIISTIDFPKQEIKLEEVFNDEKKENIKKFIDEINNPSQPNDKLKQAFEKYSEYLEDYENKNTYEHGFKDGAKWQQERSYSEEEVLELLNNLRLDSYNHGMGRIEFLEWFEQFKKK